MSSKNRDPLSGEFDNEISPIPGAPFIHHSPPPPKLQIGMTEGQKRRALRHLKYTKKRAAEGLVSSVKRLEGIEKDIQEGILPGSIEDTLRRVAKKLYGHQPTELECEQVKTYIRRKVVGKLDGITLDMGIEMYYRLAMTDPAKFEEVRAEFLSTL
jgi:hypothetical protein